MSAPCYQPSLSLPSSVVLEPIAENLAPGTVVRAAQGAEGDALCLRDPLLPGTIPAGTLLVPAGGDALFRVAAVGWTVPIADGHPAYARPCLDLEVLRPVDDGDRALELSVSVPGPALAWITLSDKGARGQREDTSGPLIREMVAGAMELRLARGWCIPDDETVLRALMADLALVQGYDLILTTGGTGVAPRDITPEATLAVIDKRLPGFERAMTAASLEKTPHGAISRAVAGTIGRSIVVNMPGSRKAVAENLEAVLPALGHALAKLQGDPTDCGS